MFSDQTVIVTGGANGIELATVKAFLAKNARVVIADIAQEAGQRAQKELAREKNNCLFILTDTGCESSIQKMVQQTIQTFGPISVLVNGAACFIMKGVEATPPRLGAGVPRGDCRLCLVRETCCPLHERDRRGRHR